MVTVADDGASKGSFNKACERCKQGGVQLMFLHRQKQWLCPICTVNACYDDAVKEIVALFTSYTQGIPAGAFGFGQPMVPAEQVRQLALKIQDQQREQLEGPKQKPPSTVRR